MHSLFYLSPDNYFLLDLRPIDEDDPSDNFFDVALDTARVPEDPVSTFAEGRSKSYMVNLAENEGFFE